MTRTLQAIGLFVVTAMAVSWGLVGAAAAEGALATVAGRTIVIWLFPIGPLVASLVVQRWRGRPFSADSLGLSLTGTPWLPAAWFVPILLGVGTLLVERMIPTLSVSFSPAMHLPPLPSDAGEEMRKSYEDAKHISPFVVIIGQLGMAVFFGALLNSVVALAEEVGWRGVLLKELAVFGFWRAVVLTGLIVGMWSLPLVLLGEAYTGAERAGLAMMVAFSLLVAPLTTFMRLSTGSVIGAAIFHGTLRSMQLFVALGYVSGSSLLAGVPGAAGMSVILLGTVVVVGSRWREADHALRAMATAEPISSTG